MTRLLANASIDVIGDVLANAAVVGRRAWSDRPHGANRVTSDPAEGLPPGLAAAQVRDLFRVLNERGLPYVLVGGVALLRYVDGRNTEDIDLILSVDSLPLLPEIVLSDRNPHFARGRFQGVRVDLLLTAHPLFKLVQDRHADTHRFQEADVRVATVEGLMLLKLFALPSLYRRGDGQRIAVYEADLMMLLQRYRPAMPPLFETLAQHVDATVLSELRSIVGDIETRIARIERASGGGPA